MEISENRKNYYGRTALLPQPVPLSAGPLSLIYQGGDLRYIRVGNREIIRRIYVAVRDQHWGTIPATFSRVTMDVQLNAFRIHYRAEHVQGDVDFAWTASIIGSMDGTITFTMSGEARSTFLRNRIGFCVLHPMSAAGDPVMVRHINGTITEGYLPELIAPHQPFKEIATIAHAFEQGMRCEVMFSGEVFEMEDQRNWTDASYKTYGTPLEKPYPVEIEAGTRIEQSVTVRHSGVPVEATPPPESLTFMLADEVMGKLPDIGLSVSADQKPLTPEQIHYFKRLNLSHLRAELRQSNTAESLRRADSSARALGLPLEIALYVEEVDLDMVRGWLDAVKLDVCRWVILRESADACITAGDVKRVRHALADLTPGAAFGGGADQNFTELNRNRPDVETFDFVSYALNPQVHAFDNESMVENLSTQAATLESARVFCADKPLIVSPVTLKKRYSPRKPAPGELPAAVDPRQMSLFGACWTLGSIKYLAEGGASSVTYYELVGWRGVMEAQEGAPLPEQFPSTPGGFFPIYHVFGDVGEFRGADVLRAESNDPLTLNGIALRRQDGAVRLLLANMTPNPQSMTLRGLLALGAGDQVFVKRLDQTSIGDAVCDVEKFLEWPGTPHKINAGSLDLRLLPFAILRIDLSQEDL